MTKDLKFRIGYKQMTVIYGGKEIITVSVYDEDMDEMKAVLFALQAEMQKEVIEFLQKQIDGPQAKTVDTEPPTAFNAPR